MEQEIFDDYTWNEHKKDVYKRQVLIMIGLLFLVTYVPDIIMFIPNNFM